MSCSEPKEKNAEYIVSGLDGNGHGAFRFEFLFERRRDIFSHRDIFPWGCRFVLVPFIRLCIDLRPSETRDISENGRVIPS